jgi:hypothetical protein
MEAPSVAKNVPTVWGALAHNFIMHFNILGSGA